MHHPLSTLMNSWIHPRAACRHTTHYSATRGLQPLTLFAPTHGWRARLSCFGGWLYTRSFYPPTVVLLGHTWKS